MSIYFICYFQVSDCHQGIIVDSLNSKFTSTLPSAATILLRAINNRKYIFALTLKYDYERLASHNEKMEIQESKTF